VLTDNTVIRDRRNTGLCDLGAHYDKIIPDLKNLSEHKFYKKKYSTITAQPRGVVAKQDLRLEDQDAILGQSSGILGPRTSVRIRAGL